MAIGCNFICDNDKCEHHGKAIVLTGPWPMASIDEMILLFEREGDEDHANHLKAMQENEREYACITLPDTYGIEPKAYRIQKWCDKCHIISIFESELDDVYEVTSRADICMNCEETALTGFQHAINYGIDCPFCKERMKQERWYANEQEE